jgi:hypothetical protein
MGQKHTGTGTYEDAKAFLQGNKTGLFVNFGNFHVPDPDQGQQNQCGSGPQHWFL